MEKGTKILATPYLIEYENIDEDFRHSGKRKTVALADDITEAIEAVLYELSESYPKRTFHINSAELIAEEMCVISSNMLENFLHDISDDL